MMRAIAIAGCVLASACSIDEPRDVAPRVRPAEWVEVVRLPVVINWDLDLLFVIDNTRGMTAKQEALVAGFAAMLRRMEQVVRPNLHIGVITTDMGTALGDGSVAPPYGAGPGACAMRGDGGGLRTSTEITGNFISRAFNQDGTTTTNFLGPIEAAFGKLARVGESGCVFPQPFAAVTSALGPHPQNAGFLRSHANLMVVALSQHDDCSARDAGLFATLDPTWQCFTQGVVCSPDEPEQPGAKTDCQPRESASSVTSAAAFRTFLLGLKAGDARKVSFVSLVAPANVSVELAPDEVMP